MLLATLFVACGGRAQPSHPTPVTNPPQITCPTDVLVSGVPSATQAVEFDVPSLVAGTPPVQIACTPESGSEFPLGSTGVTCRATDADARTASCSFRVTLKGFSIAFTKYEAFGDSLTAGEVGRPNIARINDADTPSAYPTKLQAWFDALYPTQGITVINRGIGGHVAAETDAEILKFAAADRPEVVLLLTGYNDLRKECDANGPVTPACRDIVLKLGADIRSCIRHAREVDAALKLVFVSTLTPPGATGSNRIGREAIVQANQQIKSVVSSERAVLVDSYAAFLGRESEYVNVDGLHLTSSGYQALADGFFAAIQATVTRTPLLGRF
jgi:lysophospholipase L1-like esterase